MVTEDDSVLVNPSKSHLALGQALLVVAPKKRHVMRALAKDFYPLPDKQASWRQKELPLWGWFCRSAGQQCLPPTSAVFLLPVGWAPSGGIGHRALLVLGQTGKQAGQQVAASSACYTIVHNAAAARGMARRADE